MRKKMMNMSTRKVADHHRERVCLKWKRKKKKKANEEKIEKVRKRERKEDEEEEEAKEKRKENGERFAANGGFWSVRNETHKRRATVVVVGGEKARLWLARDTSNKSNRRHSLHFFAIANDDPVNG